MLRLKKNHCVMFTCLSGQLPLVVRITLFNDNDLVSKAVLSQGQMQIYSETRLSHRSKQVSDLMDYEIIELYCTRYIEIVNG